MSVYHNLFGSWADVVKEFGSGAEGGGFQWGSAVKTIVGAPSVEPEEVLWADYEYEDYSGDALVIYRQGNKVFEVSGGHCSCFGLEGQWQPEEYDLQTYVAAVDKRGDHAGLGRSAAAAKVKLLLVG